MASNIIIGSLIACKLLISEPIIEENRTNQIAATSGNITFSRLTNVNSMNNEAEYSEKEEIVVGKVIDINEKEVWVKQESGKFKKDKKRMLKIKADNLVDFVMIKEEACGLYDDIIEKEKVALKEDVKNIKPKKIKKKVNKKEEEFEEEYIIVPLDYDLKDKSSYQEIKNDDLKKKIDKALISYLNKNDKVYDIEPDKKKLVAQNKKNQEKEELLKKVALRQEELFAKNDPIKKEEPKSKKKINIVKKENDSFLGESIIANFESDLKKEIKKKQVIKEDEPKKKIKVVKKEDFSNLNLIVKAFSFIVKEW